MVRERVVSKAVIPTSLLPVYIHRIHNMKQLHSARGCLPSVEFEVKVCRT